MYLYPNRYFKHRVRSLELISSDLIDHTKCYLCPQVTAASYGLISMLCQVIWEHRKTGISCQIEIHFSIKTTKFLLQYSLLCSQIHGRFVSHITKQTLCPHSDELAVKYSTNWIYVIHVCHYRMVNQVWLFTHLMLVLALPGKKLLETVIQPQTTVALNLLIRMK